QARETLETVLIAYPDHAFARAAMARLIELEGAQGPLASEISADSEFASGASESASSDDFQYSAEDVLAEFKNGLEKVVQPHDVRPHSNLGIAKKKRGLVDKPSPKFEIARKAAINHKREIDFLSMTALLKRQKGEPFPAVESLKQALTSQ